MLCTELEDICWDNGGGETRELEEEENPGDKTGTMMWKRSGRRWSW